jgi:hypothetical protein
MIKVDEQTRTITITEKWCIQDVADTAYPLLPQGMELDDDALWEILKNAIGNYLDDCATISIESIEAAVFEYTEAHR